MSKTRKSPKIKQRTPEETAKHMAQTYGKDWRIHATYNLMQYDQDTAGWGWWIQVLNVELKGEGK